MHKKLIQEERLGQVILIPHSIHVDKTKYLNLTIQTKLPEDVTLRCFLTFFETND